MNKLLIFLGGAAVGGLTATIYFKRKIDSLEEEYQKIATDAYNKYVGEFNSAAKNVDEFAVNYPTEDVQITSNIANGGWQVTSNIANGGCTLGIDIGNDEDKYTEIVKEYNSQEENEKTEDYIIPYMITPEEYGDDDDYDTKVLTAFTDKVVLDEDNCMADIEYFGDAINKKIYSKKNKDTSIFVRDENEKVDYEIIKENISYEDYSKLTSETEPNS